MGWVSSLLPIELNELTGHWGVLVGAAGGLVACHCLETGRLLWQLHSNCAAAIVALQLRGGGGEEGGGPPAVLFGLDAASQVHAWRVPLQQEQRQDLISSKSSKSNSSSNRNQQQQQQQQRAGATALLESCRLGAHGLGAPTCLLLPWWGSSCLFAAGWGGALCVVQLKRLGGNSVTRGVTPGAAAGDGAVGRLHMSTVRSCDLSRLRQGGGGGVASSRRSAPLAAAAAAGSQPSQQQQQQQQQVQRISIVDKLPASTTAPTRAASDRPSRSGGGLTSAGSVGGSQFGVLSMAMLEGGRLLVGLADGSVRVLRFGDPPFS